MGTKLLADTFLYGPMHLLVFFLYMGLVAGNTLVQMKQDIKDDYFPTLLTEGIVWMCIQVDSFFMNTTKIFWTSSHYSCQFSK
jgi:protein Mpv17